MPAGSPTGTGVNAAVGSPVDLHPARAAKTKMISEMAKLDFGNDFL
jgi:hypothetical protein